MSVAKRLEEADHFTARHTPGPWEWKRRNWDDPEIVADDYGLYGSDGKRVHTDGSACGEYAVDIDVAGPDATLIAAAPEMLAALKRVRQAFYAVGTSKALRAAFAGTKELVAKAEGRAVE